ncbi:MAG: quinone oxidoreductase [Rhizobiaceae bacterium]|nr:quinone oxidoreductase [Rhizobiaceae bacterium]
MAKAIRVHSNGGPEVLSFEDVAPGNPGPGEVLIRQTAIGLNFIDVYFRAGLYPPPGGFPLVPGGEGAGAVLKVGEGVRSVKPGDRVAYTIPTGAYATERLMPADRLVLIPDGVSDEQAAAVMLKGLTVEYLLRRTYKVKPGDTVLFHAAAGGVGLLFGQWAKHLGATLIGTAGSDDKLALAGEHGYDHLINYRTEDFAARVKEITGGAKCDVVYDSVGKDTFEGSLECLKPFGMFVSFGQSSGEVPPFSINLLQRKGSLYATRPTLFNYIARREDLEAASAALFDVIARGIVKVVVNQRYPLAEAARAQADLEARKTTGLTLLIP